jgi:hypothetical protein
MPAGHAGGGGFCVEAAACAGCGSMAGAWGRAGTCGGLVRWVGVQACVSRTAGVVVQLKGGREAGGAEEGGEGGEMGWGDDAGRQDFSPRFICAQVVSISEPRQEEGRLDQPTVTKALAAVWASWQSCTTPQRLLATSNHTGSSFCTPWVVDAGGVCGIEAVTRARIRGGAGMRRLAGPALPGNCGGRGSSLGLSRSGLSEA